MKKTTKTYNNTMKCVALVGRKKTSMTDQQLDSGKYAFIKTVNGNHYYLYNPGVFNPERHFNS